MLRGIKIRLLPTAEQVNFFKMIANACRFIYNWALEQQINAYNTNKKIIGWNDLKKQYQMFARLPGNGWLLAIPQKYIYGAFEDLKHNYNLAFKKTNNFPNFKSKKHCKLSFCLGDNGTYFKYDKQCNLLGLFVQKLIDPIKLKTNYQLPYRSMKEQFKLIHSPRIFFDGRHWILGLVIECEKQAPTCSKAAMGIDVGLKNYATIAFGKQVIKVKNFNKSTRIKHLEKNIRHIDRRISKKFNHNGKMESKAVKVLRKRRRKLYRKLANIRKDILHKLSRWLINLLPKAIVMEDLKIANMVKNKHLSKAIYDANWYKLRQMITYKAEELGIEVILADQWYPSSKLCSHCGERKTNLQLSDRIYHCDKCGLTLDRDVNAAINLKKLVA